jgi:hypothetical protein
MTRDPLVIIDTFPAFLETWAGCRTAPLDQQIEAWQSIYLSRWPELLAKQRACYASEGVDWQQIARERIFPFLDGRLPAMQTAHANLVCTAEAVVSAARQVLAFQGDLVLVIYVGIGCGAGWATTFQGSPAVLFGLENMAECGWTEPLTLQGLIAHEIAHVVHEIWREGHGLQKEEGPWWQLYEEGFAQRCEHVILGKDSWHMNVLSAGGDWLAWCLEQRQWLATEFLRRVDQGESVRPFFGSWYDLRGHTQCGYFLGHELIRRLERQHDLRELALLEDVERQLRTPLAQMAAGQL